jgi:mannosyltransferase
VRDRRLAPLASLVLLGGVVRFSTLDAQSLWYDEILTARLVRMEFTEMLAALPELESNPPLYSTLAWLWGQGFGTGEVGLRSLSALLGTVTIPIAYGAGSTLVSRRAGLLLAAIVAVNPLLVWYSQEARAYALLTMLGALSFLFFARSLREPTRGNLAGWAVSSILALQTHYFAVFLIGAEAVWLLVFVARRSHVAIAAAGVAAATAALLPLALEQRSTGQGAWMASWPLSPRVIDVPKQFLVGLSAPNEVAVLPAVVVVAGLWLLIRRGDKREHHGAFVAAAVGGIAALVPLALAAMGLDYLITRNLIAVWVPLVLVVAAGLAAKGAGAIGPALGVALCAFSIAVVVAVAAIPRLQREDWRGMAQALRSPTETRAVVVVPGASWWGLEHYGQGGLRLLPSNSTAVRELDVVSWGKRGLDGPTPKPPPARVPGFQATQFVPFERRDGDTFTVVRLRSSRAVRVDPALLGSPGHRPGQPTTLVQRAASE